LGIAETIGLRPDDNVDALDTIPEPDSLLLLGIGLVGMLANRRIRPAGSANNCNGKENRILSKGERRAICLSFPI